MASASFCNVYFIRILLPCEMSFESKCTMNLQIKIIKLSLVPNIRRVIQQIDNYYRAGTPCFFRMLTTVFLCYLKTNFG